MNKDVRAYNNDQATTSREICELLAKVILSSLPGATNKIWHGAPVWFLNDNPIVGHDVLTDCVRLLFWSGQSFDEDQLQNTGKFKAAEILYKDVKEVNMGDLKRWLKKSQTIQWDYKNIVKRRGVLEKLK